MERQLVQKSATLVANTANTISWTAPDFNRAFSESIIKKQVSVRFTCSSTCANSVNVGVRYSTLTKTYQISERQTLFVIPPNGSVEITPSSKPALGLLYDWITSISLDLLSASGGVVTVVCIVDDEPPPLSADPGELIGLDSKSNQDYITIVSGATDVVAANGGTASHVLYTCPSGKRFIIDYLSVVLDPTPSYPGTLLARWSIFLTSIGTAIAAPIYSYTDEHVIYVVPSISGIILAATGHIDIDVLNNSGTARSYEAELYGREVY